MNATRLNSYRTSQTSIIHVAVAYQTSDGTLAKRARARLSKDGGILQTENEQQNNHRKCFAMKRVKIAENCYKRPSVNMRVPNRYKQTKKFVCLCDAFDGKITISVTSVIQSII